MIDAVRACPRDLEVRRKPLILVDPVMGDAGKGLYVPSDVALAIASDLVPRADVVRLNAWELARLTGFDITDAASAAQAARHLAKPVLVSSIGKRDEIGVVYADRHEAWYAAHPRLASAPRGTGDLLTALFSASLIEGQPISYALVRAVGGVVEAVTAAQAWETPELPIVALGARLKTASPSVRVERVL